MSREEFYDQFLTAFRPYFHYQMEISIRKAQKDGKEKDIVVVSDPWTEDSKAFTIDGYYQDFKGGMGIDLIAQYCYMGFLAMISREMSADNVFLFLWEHAKDKVIFRIAGLFEADPYDYLTKLDWNGLTVVFQIEIGEKVIDVTQKLLELWQVGLETLLQCALENTRREYTPSLMSSPEQEDTLSLEIGAKTSGSVHILYELNGEESSEEGLRCVLYDWLLKDIAGNIGSFYILPSNSGSAVLLAESGLVLDRDQMLNGLILHAKEISPEYRVPAVVLRYDAEKNNLERIA